LTNLSIGKYTTFEQRLSSFSGIILEILVDNHRNVWLSFRRQKYNIENAKSSIWRDFLKKEQQSSFKKSEATNLLIINPNF